MKNIFPVLLMLAVGINVHAQVSVNNDGSLPGNSAMLDVKSTEKGILIPRMTSAQMQAIPAPAAGLMVYNSTSQAFFSFNGSAWVLLVAGSASMLKDADGNTKVEVEKNPNEDIIRFSLAGTERMLLTGNRLEFPNPGNNLFIGSGAAQGNTIGTYNSAFGYQALYNNIAASSNVAIGSYALYTQSYNPGYSWETNNVAVGINALYSNQPSSTGNGRFNNALGNFALEYNNTGNNNTASGHSSLCYNTSGSNNTAIGYYSLFGMYANSTGYQNTACGALALQTISTGFNNCAVGYVALSANKTGSENTATGAAALYGNISGSNNTASGREALRDNSSDNNTAVGYHASQTTSSGFQNTSIGANSLVNNTTGSYNTAIGFNTGPNSANLSNTTCLGIDATATATDMVRVGNVFVNSIGGQVGWTTLSDGRFKENVKEDVPGLTFISQLRPVSYRINRESVNEYTGTTSDYKDEMLSPITTGFIAQEVEVAAKKIGFDFSGVDAPDNEKDMYGLRYAEFVVPLVKSVQELNVKYEDQKTTNEELKQAIAELKVQNAQLMQLIEKLKTK